MAKRKPGIEKALNYINQGVFSGQLPEKLPSIRVLAHKAGVSYVTMWRSIKQYKAKKNLSHKNDGLLANNENGRKHDDTSASHPGTEPTFAYEPEHLLWQKTKNRLKKDILSGVYLAGQVLPSCKELRNRYDVSYHTFKKSLSALASEEIIRPYKKGYIVPAITVSESNARVVALGCGWEDGRIWADFQDKNYFRILESECIQSRISLDVVVYYKENGRLRFIHCATGKPYDLGNGNILGIIYIVANLQVDPREILSNLSSLQKPVAVLDVIGYISPPATVPGTRLMQFFTTTASATPPKTVARYLIGLRHTKIAFISPFHKAPWSKIRYLNCASIYRDAGFAAGVEPFVLDRFAYQWDYLQGRGNLDDLRSLVSQYATYQSKAGQVFPGKLGRLQYGIAKYLTDWNCAGGEIYASMRPLFEKALRDTTITAWVMANDFAATLAIDFLKEKKFRAPDNISIIAFDNSLDALEYQITTYDFNSNGIVTMMLRYILTPSTIPINQRGKFVDVEGRIVVRRSTALCQ